MAVRSSVREERTDIFSRSLPYILRFGILAAVLAGWQIMGDDSAQIRMPTFTRTLESFWRMTMSGELPQALVQSNIALLWGYTLALIVALPLSVAMGTIPLIRRLVDPYLTIVLSMPLIAILPVLQGMFGLGLGTRVVVIFIFAFVYITVNTTVGIRTLPDEIEEMARSFRATRMQKLKLIILPHAFPSMMAGARIGAGRAVVGMVIAELFLVSSGLGSTLAFYAGRFDSGAVLAISLTMVLEGVIIMILARKLESAVARRW